MIAEMPDSILSALRNAKDDLKHAHGGITRFQGKPGGVGRLNIGIIGDSISIQSNPTVPQVAASRLTNELALADLLLVNKARAGTDTSAWVGPRSRGFLESSLSAFSRNNVQVVSIMMGTNDADPRREIGDEDYLRNLTHIAQAVVDMGMFAMINLPPAVSDGAEERDARQAALERRAPMIRRIIDEDKRISFGGDAFAFFYNRPELFIDGIHLSVNGVNALGTLVAEWWKNPGVIRRAIT